MAGDDILLRVLAETSQARGEVESLRANFEKAVARMAVAAKQPDFDPLSADAERLRVAVNATGEAFLRAFKVGQQEAKQTAQALHAAETGVRSVKEELDRLRSNRGLASVRSSLDGIAAQINRLGPLLAAAFGVRAIANFVKESALAAVEMQALRAQLDAAAGSAAAGGRAYEFAAGKARELGFAVQDVVRSYGSFEAATRQTNLSLEQRRAVFESVIEAGRVLQLSQEQINGALTALQQIASKGKVSMEELRQQLGERLPGVLPILARELGLTVQELDKMVSSGQLLADDALPALARGLNKTFGAGLADAIETDAAAIGRLKVAIFEAKAAFGEGFSEQTREAVDSVTESLNKGTEGAREAGGTFGKLAEAFRFISQELPTTIRLLTDYNKIFLQPEAAATKLLEKLGLIPPSLRDLKNATDDMRPALELLAEKERQLRLEAEANAEVNAERVAKIYGEMIPALAALAGAESQTAEVIRKARAGDKEAQAQVEEIIRLARERVPAIKAAAEAMGELAVADDKAKTAQEQVAEALARSAKEQEEFNQKLFESKGNLFKSREELDKLRIQIINAVDSLVLLGAASVEQTDKALDFALKVAAGYREMGEAVPVELIERIDMLAAASVDGAEKVAKALREEIDAFVALGEAVPPELLARFDRLTKIIEGQERALALSALGMREFREELFGVGADIDTRTEQLAKLVDSLGLLGPATVEQGVIIRKEIQEQLDAYAELGKQPPLDLQAIADRFDVVTSRIEDQRKALKALVADFAALADKIKASRAETGASKDLAAQREELEALQAKQREGGVLTLEEVERIGELETSVSRLAGEVEGLGSDFDAFGDQATASIEDVDDAIRDLIRGNADALASLPAATQDAVANILGGLQNAATQGTATQEVIRDAMLKIADQLKIAGVETEGLTQALEDAAGGGLNLNEEFGKLGQGTDSVAEAMQKYQERVADAGKEQEDTAEGASELGKAMKEAGDAVVAEGERMKPVLVEVREIIRDIVRLCEQWKSCIDGTA